MGELEHALAAKAVTLHTKIKWRWTGIGPDGEPLTKTYDTTPGRVILSGALPKHAKVPFDVVNKLMTKKEISAMIDTVYRHCGQKESVIFCDRIMALGFNHAFKAGISFGKDDMVVPENKWSIVDDHPRAREGLRAAVQRRPDHPGREVQQGRRRLGQVLGQARRRDDEPHLDRPEGRERRATSRSTRST